jgi:hypothetical protein
MTSIVLGSGTIYLSRLGLRTLAIRKRLTYLAVSVFALSMVKFVIAAFYTDSNFPSYVGLLLDGAGVAIATFSLGKKNG